MFGIIRSYIESKIKKSKRPPRTSSQVQVRPPFPPTTFVLPSFLLLCSVIVSLLGSCLPLCLALASCLLKRLRERSSRVASCLVLSFVASCVVLSRLVFSCIICGLVLSCRVVSWIAVILTPGSPQARLSVFPAVGKCNCAWIDPCATPLKSECAFHLPRNGRRSPEMKQVDEYAKPQPRGPWAKESHPPSCLHTDRNRAIVLANLTLIYAFLACHANRFSWVFSTGWIPTWITAERIISTNCDAITSVCISWSSVPAIFV